MFQLMQPLYAQLYNPTSSRTAYNEPYQSLSSWVQFYGVVTQDDITRIFENGVNAVQHNRTYYAFFPNIAGLSYMTEVSDISAHRNGGNENVLYYEAVPNQQGYFIIKTRQVSKE